MLTNWVDILFLPNSVPSVQSGFFCETLYATRSCYSNVHNKLLSIDFLVKFNIITIGM